MTDKKHNISEKEAKEKQFVQDALDYSGVAVNDGDDGKCDSQLIKERTKTLNNNPRNGDMEVNSKG